MYKFGSNFGKSSFGDIPNTTPTDQTTPNSFASNNNNSFTQQTLNSFVPKTSNSFAPQTPNSFAPALNSFQQQTPNSFAPQTLNSFQPQTPNSFTPPNSFASTTYNSFAPTIKPTSFNPTSFTSNPTSFTNPLTSFTSNQSTSNPTSTFASTSLNQIQKVECQISLKMDNDVVKNSLLDEIIIKPKLSKVRETDIDLTTNLTKDILIKCCTIMISDDPKQLIKNSLIGGVSIVKDYTKIEVIKKIQNFIIFLNNEPIVINQNYVLSQLYEKYLISKPECIYVINETGICIGIITKNDIEISMIMNLDKNLLVYQIMKQLDDYFLESEYDWKDLMKNPNESMLIRFRNVNVLPIMNVDRQVIGEISLDNLINYYQRKNTILFNENGKIFIGVQITVDNYLKIDNLINNGVNLVYIESDNVYNERIYNIVKEIKEKYPFLIVMIGKVLTGESYKYFTDSGVDCISVGDNTEIGHLNRLRECKQEYNNYKVPIISNSGLIKDTNIYKVLIGGANCVMISELSDTTLNSIKTGLASINISNINSIFNEDIEIYKYS